MVLKPSMKSEMDGIKTSKIFEILNQSIPVLTAIYIFAHPLPLSILNIFCIYSAFTALVILLYFKRTVFTIQFPFTWPFALFLIWVFFGLFFTLDVQNSVHDIFRYLIEYLVIYYILVNNFKSIERINSLSFIIILSASIFSAGLLIIYYIIEGFPFLSRITTNYIHTNHIGFITVPATILSLNLIETNEKWKFKSFFYFCAFLLIITTIFTQSRGSLLGLIIGMAIISINGWKKPLSLIIVISLLGVIFLPGIKERFINSEDSNMERIKIYFLSAEIFKERPVTGVGFGMEILHNKKLIDAERLNNKLAPAYRQDDGHIITGTHNTLVDIAVRTGLIGLLLYLYIIATVFWMIAATLKKTKRDICRSWSISLLGCFAAFTVSSLFEDTSSGKPVLMFYVIMAMVTVIWRLSLKKAETVENIRMEKIEK